jgi:hypothetical protein
VVFFLSASRQEITAEKGMTEKNIVKKSIF